MTQLELPTLAAEPELLQCSLDRDAWLSTVLGRSAFRVSLAAASGVDRPLRPPVELESGEPGFYYAKIPAERVSAVRALGEAGFYVVDVNVLLETRSADLKPQYNGDLEIRMADRNDWDAVAEIAATAFQFSRFHLDPLISNEVANSIKRDWVQNSLLGARGDGVLIACLEGRVAGFLAMVQSIEGTSRCRTIDLIGVSPHFQRRGVGRGLTTEFLRRYAPDADLFRVGTQVANSASLRLYQQCGFQFRQSSYVLHAHFPVRETSDRATVWRP